MDRQLVNVSIQWEDGRRECYYGVGFTQDNVGKFLGVQLSEGVVRRIPQSWVTSYVANQRQYTAEGITEFDIEVKAKVKAGEGLREALADTMEIHVVADPRSVEEVLGSINLHLALESMRAKAEEADHAADLFRGERDNLFNRLKNEQARNEQLQGVISQHKRTQWELENRLKNVQAEADHFRTTLGKVIARRDELQKLLEEARQIAAERTTQMGELQAQLDHMTADRNRISGLYEEAAGRAAALFKELDQHTKDWHAHTNNLPGWDELQMLKDIREAITIGKQEHYRTDDIAEAVMGVFRPCSQHLLHMNRLVAEWRSKHDELRRRMARYLADTCYCLHCSIDAGAEPDILDTYMNRISNQLTRLLQTVNDQDEKLHSQGHQINNLQAQLSMAHNSTVKVELDTLKAMCRELGLDTDPGDVPDPALRLSARIMRKLTDLRGVSEVGLMETWRRLACKAVGLDVEYVVAKLGTNGVEDAINQQNNLLAAVRGIATRFNVDQTNVSCQGGGG